MSDENRNICFDPSNLTPSILSVIKELANKSFGAQKYRFEASPISASWENSYGLVLQLRIIPEADNVAKVKHYILKMAPTNEARRAHMKVAEYYEREVFMYESVLTEFYNLYVNNSVSPQKLFDCLPRMYAYSLNNMNEYIFFKDLTRVGYTTFSRRNRLTFDLMALALKSLAKFHATSFILQEKNNAQFEKLVDNIRHKDNLFTENIDKISIDFAKKYIKKTIDAVKARNDLSDKQVLLNTLQKIYKNYKTICIHAVKGNAPHSVICHGDFWNNNILYRYNNEEQPLSAALVDLQMSRYSSPVLDIVNYLFTCAEKDVRDECFHRLLQVYHDALADQLRLFDIDVNQIYSWAHFQRDLELYGVYGYCMASLSVPFFISESGELPELDEICEAIQELSADENYSDSDEPDEKSANLLAEYELLTEKTLPIFNRRMVGVVQDLVKYNMLKFSEKYALKEN